MIETALIFTISNLFSFIFADTLYKKSLCEFEASRKVLHIFSGIICIIFTIYAKRSLPLIASLLFFAVIFIPITLKLNLFAIQRIERGYGTFFFALSYILLTLLFWDEGKEYIIASMATLTFGDSLAAIVGTKYGKTKYKSINSTRSVEGSLTCIIVSFSIIYTILALYREISPMNMILVSLLSAILIASGEAVSHSGFDNLMIPGATILSLHLFQDASLEQNLLTLSIILVIFAFSAVLRKMKLLDAAAVICFFFFSTLIYCSGGPAWLLPIYLFFLTISLLGRMNHKRKNDYNEFEGTKTIGQIYANGLFATVTSVLYFYLKMDSLYLVFLSVVASNAADSWASEFGGFSKKPVVVTLPFFRKVEKGVSGGITLLGNFGAVLGALLIALNVLFFYKNASLQIVASIILLGFCGNLFDSLLGSQFQGLYECIDCGKKTEKKDHCELGNHGRLIRGISGLNNNHVNFLSSLTVWSIAMAFYISIRN